MPQEFDIQRGMFCQPDLDLWILTRSGVAVHVLVSSHHPQQGHRFMFTF